MQITLRPTTLVENPQRMVELYGSFNPEPFTAEQFQEWHENFPADGLRHMVAAVDNRDQILAYGEAIRLPWNTPGLFYVEAVVDPAHRRRGIAAAMDREILQWCRENGGTELRASARDNEEQSQRFLTTRGYQLDRHIFESTLTPATFDDARFAGVVDAVKVSGIRFVTLADERSDDLEQKYYELNKVTAKDIPGWDQPGYPPFEQWRKWVMESRHFDPALHLFAMDGDRVAGVTAMHQIPETKALYTDYTGVAREYRGRQVALALKLQAVTFARKYGAPYMRTNNDSKNAPMLAVNRKLGYVPSPGWFRYKLAL